MDKIYQITYRSSAQNGISRKEISALLDIAKVRNPEMGAQDKKLWRDSKWLNFELKEIYVFRRFIRSGSFIASRGDR